MSSWPREAVVLAGGEGRRLRPLTRYQPKPMLPVGTQPIIDYVVDALFEAGVERLVVVVGHRRERIQTHLTDRFPDRSLSFVHQERQLGSGHALLQAENTVSEEFLVVNGDIVVDERTVGATVDRYRESDTDAALAVTTTSSPDTYGVVEIDDGRVVRIQEPPAATDQLLVNAGVYATDRSVFDALREVDQRDGERYLTDAFARLSAAAVQTDGLWLAPSNPWRLLSATEELLSVDGEHRVAPSASIHESAVVDGPVRIGPGVDVGANVIVGGGTCLCENATVNRGAIVERSIVSPDARVGEGAVLLDSILGQAVTVGPGVVAPAGPADFVIDDTVYRERAAGSVVADRATVGANVTIPSGTRIGPAATVHPGATVHRDVPEGAEVLD
jgi:glucose-1-phosphate thymidylyltransferase